MGFTPLVERPLSAALYDAINRTAERGKEGMPFYQLEISLSLSAPKTHISFILVMVHFPEASCHICHHARLALLLRFTHSVCCLAAGVTEVLLDADRLTFFFFNLQFECKMALKPVTVYAYLDSDERQHSIHHETGFGSNKRLLNLQHESSSHSF